MSTHALVAACLTLALLPPLEAPTRTDLKALREDVHRMQQDLDAIAVAGTVATNLARMESHLHLVRARVCESCRPSVYDEVEADCGEGHVVTSALSPERYEALMRDATQWMRDRLARMSHERSPYERERLGYQYYNAIRDFIAGAEPACRAQGRP
jgi:hypothetical protein